MSPRRNSTPAAQAALVARFNAVYEASGVLVLVELDSGQIRITRTRSPALLASGEVAVIFVEGIAGYYSLSRVRVVKRKGVKRGPLSI